MTTRTVLAAALALLSLGACAPPAEPGPPRVAPSTPAAVPPGRVPQRRASPAAGRITYPEHGQRRWSVAAAQTGPASGRGGRLLRYRVAVERDIRGLATASFAQAVQATLADRRGWTAGGLWRFQRVGVGEPYDFTIYLVTPDTRDVLCADVPDGYTSCRNGDRVVLNVDRWVHGVPAYGTTLANYRTYMVNHEVGHRLGHGHQRCPGEGEPAPVMQQQTLGLRGCEANSWPYLGGRYY
jgi:hypothetical protein